MQEYRKSLPTIIRRPGAGTSARLFQSENHATFRAADATPTPTEAFQTALKEFRTRQFQAAETSFALAAET